MSQDVLDPIDQADELALTLARAREFARALGILDDLARRDSAALASGTKEDSPERVVGELTAPCCVPDGGDSEEPAER